MAAMTEQWSLKDQDRKQATARATAFAQRLRTSSRQSPMEAFLSQYGLSTQEGVALMCLAEALLRVPDTDTVDALIEDKISPHSWAEHLGKASSPLVNASTWALMFTGKVLEGDGDPGLAQVLRGAIKRLGEPVIRLAVQQAMKVLGQQFVLGRSIAEAQDNARENERQGYCYSYDMLGEAAMTAADAQRYFAEYSKAIAAIAQSATSTDVRHNPGISIKLSALHPRYDALQKGRVMDQLVPRVRALAKAAAKARIGFNIDAEEADRLELSLDVIEAVLRDPALAGWGGFGVVVQAYSKRALGVIDWLQALAETLDRRIMVRLVKGAYWDTEIKHAQEEGQSDYPVFTRKAHTDAAYLSCARRLLAADRLYPQFATHNAHTIAAILTMAKDTQGYEFQRLHGMGEELHAIAVQDHGALCRIYAPVGAHKDLLAYLVRRLLENGANSSFVNQITDTDVPLADVVADPFDVQPLQTPLPKPEALFAPVRVNSRGWDLRAPDGAASYDAARRAFVQHRWQAAPLAAGVAGMGMRQTITNPANPNEMVGTCIDAAEEDVAQAIANAVPWAASAKERADVLRRAADVYEAEAGEIFALLAREAGKTAPDAVSELREAVDFLRFYAVEAERLSPAKPRGIFTCISPWNFPLAIFTGQVAAALAAGNAVLAKPAEQTPLIAFVATQLMHRAGVPQAALQLLPGPGQSVGAQLVSDPRINGVCFTGSTATAQTIHSAMAEHLDPSAPLIAETGGLNAMIVDSTALLEQAVGDTVMSAFQSAGQRCSALRVLYVQEDIAEPFLTMLYGAMDELSLGAPWTFESDIGPVIGSDAQRAIAAYIEDARRDGRLLKQLEAPVDGHYVGPSVI
ncbi:MAG: bifunctional proline dehydrogenase/L-glutamate gamma-semialdehyde dehydrogenase PutA, partial [Pseudomonadota bacterium]